MSLTDDQITSLLREVPLPDAPSDRYDGVVAHRRRAAARRTAAVSGALATVVAVVAVVVTQLPHRPTRPDTLLAGDVSTAHVLGTSTFGGDGAFALEGDVDFTHHALSFLIRTSLPSGGAVSQVRERQITIGSDTWTARDLDGASPTSWTHQHDDLASDDFSQLDPATLYNRVKAVPSDLRDLGRVEVDGTATTRFAVQANHQEGSPFKDTPGQLFVDDAGLVRRVVTEQDGGSFTFTFSDFGKPVHVTPPPAGQVHEAEVSTVIPDCAQTGSAPSASADPSGAGSDSGLASCSTLSVTSGLGSASDSSGATAAKAATQEFCTKLRAGQLPRVKPEQRQQFEDTLCKGVPSK